MKYSKAAIEKFMNEAKAALDDYMNVPIDQLHLVVSKGNSKIGNVLNVSLLPIFTCHNCKECKNFCYDIKACLQYKNVMNARAMNTALLLRDRDRFFTELDNALNRRKKNKFFRFHVAGDIVDKDYFNRMVELTRKHKDFIFWTYTKHYMIVNSYCDKNGRDAIPKNFKIMFSKWDGLKIVNPHNFPVFACKLAAGNKDYIPFDVYYKCPGNCDICKKHKKGCIAGMNTYADEH